MESTNGIVGQKLIHAIDTDDFEAILKIFGHDSHSINTSAVDIDTIVNINGYMNYKWTPWIAQFLGDSLLHIALKEKKTKCIDILLLLQANTSLQNYFRETSNTIAQSKLGVSIAYLKYNATLNLAPYITLPMIHKYSKLSVFHSLHKEALHLYSHGRNLISTHSIETDSSTNESESTSRHMQLVGDIKILSTNSNLKYMRWKENDIKYLANYILNSHIITSVTLSSISMNNAKLKILLPALASLQKLRVLDLSRNCIDDECIVAFSVAFQESACQGLKLTLVGNRITYVGASALITSLHSRCKYLK
jgi:hypothetical protein